MLIRLKAKNCFIFGDEITFSMKADMRTKRFATNVYQNENVNILKVSGIYGANNSGKTCLIKCLKAIKNVLMHEKIEVNPNIFSGNRIIELGVTFLNAGKEYSYDFKFDTENGEYIYECFAELNIDKYGNETERILILRDIEKCEYACKQTELKSILPLMARNNILIYLIDSESFEEIDEMKNILVSFASKIDIVDMNNIPIKKTIDILKNEDDLQSKVVDFIKNADLYLDDYKYISTDSFEIKASIDGEEPAEKVLRLPDGLMDQFRLTSVYKGRPVPSLIFDSTGTKKNSSVG